ncbi:hypothetical protein ACHAQJ_010098 [Trichoderma viride]
MAIQYGRAEAAMMMTSDSSTTTLGREKPICKFFRIGSCMYGESCVYRHEKQEHTSWTAVNEPVEDEFNKGNFTRTISGAFVQLDAGARVSKIRLPNDFSAVCITGLQRNTSEQSVRDMLADIGLDACVEDVHILNVRRGCQVTVRSDDASFSQRFCALVEPGYTWRCAEIQATPITAPMPSGYNDRQVDCRKVSISWPKAIKTIVLSFGSANVALKVSEMFSKGAYRVLGQRVTAGPAEGAGPDEPERPPRVAFTVMLTDVSSEADEGDIKHAISHEWLKPHEIEMGPPSYPASIEHASAAIRSLLTDAGPLEYFELELERTAMRVKVTAGFLDESDAQRAAMELDRTELPFYSQARLTVNVVYSAKFTVGTDMYDAVYSTICNQNRAWRSNNVSFWAYPSTDLLQRLRVLRIEGLSAQGVASAKADLESTLAGVVAKKGSIVLWDSSLKANGRLYQAIKELEKKLSMIILRDKVKSELRLFGPQEACEEAQHRLFRLICTESLSTSTRIIELQDYIYSWASHGGFKKITNRLGPGKVALDIISTPKRIIISGSLEDYDLALAIMAGREEVVDLVEQPRFNKKSLEECSVCWTEAGSHIKISCGHVYCLDCFESTCVAGGSAATDFAIECHGDQGNCRSVIGVADLRQHLSPAVLEDVLKRSFSSHVKRNLNEFRYCPTPDCGYIYRVTSDAKTLNCSNCLRPTCSACHEPHVGMSCAEHHDIKSGNREAFMKLKAELGIKDCPKCETPLEKVSGCNHITCEACKAHICWVCLETFPDSDSVYEHMGELHENEIEAPEPELEG